MKIKKIFVLSIIVLTVSCNNQFTKSRHHRIAMKDLTYHDYEDNYELIPLKELTKKKYLIHHLDTIPILSKKTKTIGFRNIKSKRNFIFQFEEIGYYKTIESDSLWNVDRVSESMGKIY